MATKEAKLELLRENLAEVLNPEIIDEVLDKGETLRIYWGESSLVICCDAAMLRLYMFAAISCIRC